MRERDRVKGEMMEKPHQKYIKCNSIALNMDITYGHSNELDVEKHVTYFFIHTNIYIHNFHLTVYNT